MACVYKTSPEKCTGPQYIPRDSTATEFKKLKNVPILITSRGNTGMLKPPPQVYKTELGDVTIDNEGYQHLYVEKHNQRIVNHIILI